MDRFEFDDLYVRRLKEHDRETEAHFDHYFRPRLFSKLYGHGIPIQEIDDAIQNVFVRVLAGLDGLRESCKLAAFVLGYANNVAWEVGRDLLRKKRRTEPLDEVYEAIAGDEPDALTKILRAEVSASVREVLRDMDDPRDTAILWEIFLDDEDRDAVCRRFGVTPEYLRVLLHRAIQKFKAAYRRRTSH